MGSISRLVWLLSMAVSIDMKWQPCNANGGIRFLLAADLGSVCWSGSFVSNVKKEFFWVASLETSKEGREKGEEKNTINNK